MQVSGGAPSGYTYGRRLPRQKPARSDITEEGRRDDARGWRRTSVPHLQEETLHSVQSDTGGYRRRPFTLKIRRVRAQRRLYKGEARRLEEILATGTLRGRFAP